MNEAFSIIYGSYGSPLARVFGPVIHPRSYLRAIHLLAMFPLGLAYFVGLVVSLSVGGVLVWTFVGVIILIVALFLTRWAGDAEAWLVSKVTRIELKRPPTAIESGLSAREQVWTRLIDPTTWTGVVYLFAQFPIGIATFAGLVAAGAISGAFVSAPVVTAVSNADLNLFGWHVDTWEEGFVLVPLGLLLFLTTVHLVNVVSAIHAWWARLMLGSRARTLPEVPVDFEPPPGDHDRDSQSAIQQPDALPHADSSAAGLASLATLTPREREVLGLIARGHSNAEIAEAFVISEGTVKTHVKRLLSKLDVRDRAQATSFAFETGFVKPRNSDPENALVPIISRRRTG